MNRSAKQPAPEAPSEKPISGERTSPTALASVAGFLTTAGMPGDPSAQTGAGLDRLARWLSSELPSNLPSPSWSTPWPALAVLGLGLTSLALAVALHRLLSDARGEPELNRSTQRALDALALSIHGESEQPPERLRAGLTAFDGRDPSFDGGLFGRQGCDLIKELQRALQPDSGARLGQLRARLSDGMFQHLSVRRAAGRAAPLGGEPVAESASIVGVESDDDFDTLHLRIQLAAGSASPRRAPGPRQALCLTFLRRPTLESGVASSWEGVCPKCRAPLAGLECATCPSCQAPLNSGNHGWVLARLCDAAEFRVAQPAAIDGFARLKALDPALHRSILEDRARLVFWARQEALSRGSTTAFARYALPQALARLAPGIQSPPVEHVLGDRVELVLLENDGEMERAFFKLRWCLLGQNAGSHRVQEGVLHLMRRSGRLTSTRAGLATGRCPSCSAEVALLGPALCGACGSPLTDDWTFVECLSPEAFQIRREKGAVNRQLPFKSVGVIADEDDRCRALAQLVAQMRSDGELASRDKALLRQCARRWDLSDELLDDLLSAQAEELAPFRLGSPEETRAFFRSLCDAALVDGKLDAGEERRLRALAQRLKLAPEDVQGIVQARQVGDAARE